MKLHEFIFILTNTAPGFYFGLAIFSAAMLGIIIIAKEDYHE